MFRDILAPILIKENTCLLALSTVAYKANHFFARLVANSAKSFKVIRVKFICEQCEAKGLRDEVCRHRRDCVPHWAAESVIGIIKELVGKEGQSRIETENLGLDPVADDSEVFKPALIQDLLTKDRIPLTRDLRQIFLIVDPCAGSIRQNEDRPSDFAILTFGYPGNIWLGMESLPANKSEDYEAILVSHLKTLRAKPHCRFAQIVVDVESGTGLTAGDVQRLVKDHFNQVVIMDDDSRKPGRQTTYKMKAELVQLTAAALRKKEVFIYDEFVTHHPKPKDLWGKWHQQMLKYAQKKKQLRDGNISFTYTGKGNGDEQDDLALTFQRGVRTMIDFFNLPKYAEHCV